jgi:hypothetical protein
VRTEFGRTVVVSKLRGEGSAKYSVSIASLAKRRGQHCSSSIVLNKRRKRDLQTDRVRAHSYLNRCFSCGVGRLECLCLFDWNARGSHEPLGRGLPAQGMQ